MGNNKGFSVFMLIIIVGALALVAVWYSLYNKSASPLDISKIKDVTTKKESSDLESVTTDGSFDDIEENEFTPIEVNDEALDELDSIMNSLEEEDMSDLSDL